MKKKMSLIVMCAALLLLTACGKEKTVGSNDAGGKTESTSDAGQEKESAVSKDGVLLGVYEGATDYIEVPMGTFFQGEQKDFCKIKMPVEYIISANYSDNGENSLINSDIFGIKVGNLAEKKLENEVANHWITIASSGGTTMYFAIFPSTTATMEDEKAYAGEYKEIKGGEHPAIYFVDSYEYSTSDLEVSYELNEDMLLRISYEGPVADQIGLDQLAQNLYDLVEVIE